VRAALGILAVVAVACGGQEAGDVPAERAEAPVQVPGLETATAETVPLRDTVRGFGAVAPAAEPPDVRDARAALAEAEARRRLAEQQVSRLETLANGLAPRKELDAARAELASAAATAARARQALAAFGADERRGALAAGETWVIAHVLQLDVARIAADAAARFLPDAYPGRTFTGRVDAAPAYVDPATRTAPVRVRVRDPDALLRPGMTGAAMLEVGAARDAVVVPAAAVVYDDAQPLVFVVDGGRYARRAVTVGTAAPDGRVEVRAGLAAGTRVVTTGAASLLSAARLPATAAEGD